MDVPEYQCGVCGKWYRYEGGVVDLFAHEVSKMCLESASNAMPGRFELCPKCRDEVARHVYAMVRSARCRR